MQVEYLNFHHFKICRTDLCNSIEISDLTQNTCEGYNNSIFSKKLIYSQSILNPESTKRVSECYYCNDKKPCLLEDTGSVENCNTSSKGCKVKSNFNYFVLIKSLKKTK